MLPFTAANRHFTRFTNSFHSAAAQRTVLIALLCLLPVITTSCGLAAQTPDNFQSLKAATSEKKLDGSSSSRITVSGSMPKGAVGQPFNAVVSVSGGAAPYQFSIVFQALPPGLTINASTGVISGTPQAAEPTCSRWGRLIYLAPRLGITVSPSWSRATLPRKSGYNSRRPPPP